MPFIHPFIDNDFLAQHVLDVIFSDSETLDQAELKLARRFKREDRPSPHLITTLMTIVMQSNYAAMQEYLLNPERSIAKSVCLLFMHVVLSFDDALPETISPLKYAFKNLDTRMWSLIDETIQEHCPELMPFFEEQLRSQSEQMDFSPIVNAYKLCLAQYALNDNQAMLQGTFKKLGALQKTHFPPHLLQEFCREGNVWRLESRFDDRSLTSDFLARIFTNPAQCISRKKLGSSYTLVRGQRENAYAFPSAPDKQSIEHDLAVIQHLFKIRRDERHHRQLTASQKTSKDNHAVARIIENFNNIYFQGESTPKKMRLTFSKQVQINNQTYTIKPGQFATLPACTTKVILLGIHGDYIWFKHPHHCHLMNTNVTNFLIMNLEGSGCVSTLEFLALIYLNSNYLDSVLERNLNRYLLHSPITRGNSIGSGSEGTVYQATYEDNAVAVKVLTTNENALELIALTLIKEMIPDNNFLVKFHGHTNISSPQLIFEYMNDGTLEDFLENTQKFNIDLCPLIIEHIARALKLLHAHKLIHRDIKPANIFLSRQEKNGQTQFVAKLGDFGFTILDHWLADFACTPYFLAPELLIYHRSKTFPLMVPGSSNADMFAFGITIWLLINRKPLYPGCQRLSELKYVVCHLKNLPAHDVGKDAPPPLIKMAAINSWCTKFQPKERATAEQIVNAFAGDDKLAISGELSKYAPA